MEDRKFEPTEGEPADAPRAAEPTVAPPATKKTRARRPRPAAARSTKASNGRRVSRKTTAKKPVAKKKAAPGTSKRAPEPPQGKPVSRFVVLFRHGVAEEHSLEKPDGDRSLTAGGHAKTKQATRGLEEIFPEADTIYSSPLLRALQTALWLAKAYAGKLKIQVTDALLPGADPSKLAALVASQPGRNVVLVGHEPQLTNAFAHFVGGASSLRADLRKAGCIGIRLDADGTGTLEWMLAPRMLRRLD